MQRNSLGLAVSFGGTKIAVALIDPVTADIVAKTDSIPWRTDPIWQPDDPLCSLVRLVAEYSHQLSEKSGHPLSAISRIGIAWPGPGRYSHGMLTATFIPGCSEPQDIHALIRAAVREVSGFASIDDVDVCSYLDVVARARGITRRFSRFAVPAIADRRAANGIVLNIATGMAGAIIHQGQALLVHPILGESYGQWGRFLFWHPQEGVWSWHPTKNGSVREGIDGVRFTDLCGGPAIARRFFDLWSSETTKPPVSQSLARLLSQYPDDRIRDVDAEKCLLRALTHEVGNADEFVCSFITDLGRQIGSSLPCLREGLGDEYFGDFAILTGGIGEYFAAPLPDTPMRADQFVESVYEAAGMRDITVARTTDGLDAELIGCIVG